MTGMCSQDPTDAPENAAPIVHMTQRELARRWRCSPRSLERWRVAGKGPAWLRLNSRVRYRLEDVLAFERASLQAAGGPVE